MRLYQKPGSQTWHMDFTHPVTGKRVRRSTQTTNKRLALEVTLRALHDPSKPPEDHSQVTFRKALEDYVADLALSGKVSAVFHKGRIAKLFGTGKTSEGKFFFDPDRALSSLRPVDMQDLITARRHEGASAQTIAHEIKLIRAATRFAASLGHAVPTQMVDRSLQNPWRIPSLPMKCRSRTGRVYYTPVQDHVRRSRQNCQDLLVTLTLTGGRWTEIAGLTWDRVDVNDFSTMRLWGNKTGAERLVPVPLRVREVLKRRHATRDNERIFPGTLGRDGVSITPCAPLLKAMTACGLNRPDIVRMHGRATVHSLRHTFASWLIQNDADLSQVQEMLGHKTIHMTLRYAHLSGAKTAQQMANILDRVMDDRDG